MKFLSLGLAAIAFVLLITTNIKPAFCQDHAPGTQERKYEVYVCKSPQCADYPLPLKIVEVRNLQNEFWWRDLEIEVKNISDKPIYFIVLVVSLPDSRSPGGVNYGSSLVYGRYDLVDLSKRPMTEDIPLKSGESYIFKIPKHIWPTFDQPESVTRRVAIRIQNVNFGDGTGLTMSGAPLPNRRTTNPLPYYRIIM